VIQRIEFVGLSPELEQRVQNRLTVREGDTLSRADWERLRAAVTEIDEHLAVIMQYDGNYVAQRLPVVLRMVLRSEGARTTAVVRVGGGASPVPIVRVEPEYSEEARRAKWQGTVLLQVTVDENGVPQDIKVIRPLGMGLDQNAVDAVQKWRFKPMLLNGKPVSVSANIEINFRL